MPVVYRLMILFVSPKPDVSLYTVTHGTQLVISYWIVQLPAITRLMDPDHSDPFYSVDSTLRCGYTYHRFNGNKRKLKLFCFFRVKRKPSIDDISNVSLLNDFKIMLTRGNV